MSSRLRADFNGLFGGLLCLSHGDTALDETGALVELRQGMLVTAYDEDIGDDGARDDVLATGVVERSPAWLKCLGSKWVLRIDSRGVHRESDVVAKRVGKAGGS